MGIEEMRAALREHLADNNVGEWCPDGWIPLAYATHQRLLTVNPDYRIVQVKEKFGQLRYSTTVPMTAEMREVVQEAYEASVHMCQNCGAEDAGSVDAGWVATLCDACIASSDFDRRGYRYV